MRASVLVERSMEGDSSDLSENIEKSGCHTSVHYENIYCILTQLMNLNQPIESVEKSAMLG